MIYKMPYREDYNYSYYSPRNPYMLVYSDDELDGEKIEVRDLNSEEFAWFLACKQDVINRLVKRHKKEIDSILDGFLDDFEKELERIKNE